MGNIELLSIFWLSNTLDYVVCLFVCLLAYFNKYTVLQGIACFTCKMYFSKTEYVI